MIGRNSIVMRKFFSDRGNSSPLTRIRKKKRKDSTQLWRLASMAMFNSPSSYTDSEMELRHADFDLDF